MNFEAGKWISLKRERGDRSEELLEGSVFVSRLQSAGTRHTTTLIDLARAVWPEVTEY